MNQHLQSLKSHFLQKMLFACILTLLLFSGTLQAQTTVSSTSSFTNDSTVSVVTFNLQNTNSYPIMIIGMEGIVSDYGLISTELWYKTTPVSGAPGAITTANGWVQSVANTLAGNQNTTTTVTQPLFNTLNLIIPANTTYGIAVAAYDGSNPKLRVGNSAASVNVSAGGCNFITGNNIGYSSEIFPGPLTLSPKGWIGKISFVSGVACSGTPNVPTVTGPLNICANAMFGLSAAGYSIAPGLTYQWQKYNTGTATWEDISFATSPNVTINTGIAAATQYRFKTTCASSGLSSYSATYTVNIGTGLPGGNYTINRLSASSTTNFTSFSAAAAAMKCGISGPITIDVIAGSGPYTEMAVFNNIPGASAVNKIRINGHNQEIEYESPSNTDTGVINLIGTRYITIDSVTVRQLSQQYGMGIMLSDSCSHDSIMHCFIDMTSINATFAATWSVGIGQGNWYNNNYLYDDDYNNCYIGYNHILGSTQSGGMYIGIDAGGYFYNYGNNDNGNDTGNVIEHNDIENFDYIGISSNGSNGTRILYNDIHRPNKEDGGSVSNFIGILCRTDDNYYNQSQNYVDTTHDFVEIVGNRIHDPSLGTGNGIGFIGIELTEYGYYNFNYDDYGSSILVANNAIYNVNAASSNFVYGIYCLGNYNYSDTSNLDTFQIFHNTIDLSAAGAQSQSVGDIVGINYYENNFNTNNNNSEAVFIDNNLVTIAGQASNPKFGFAFYDYYNNNSNTYVNCQRNNYYLNSTITSNQYYGNYNNVDYSTITAFHAAHPTLEAGSLTVDPQYLALATGDLTPTNLTLLGNGINLQSHVPKDINGKSRSTAPTPGAFEIGRDGAVTSLLSPVGTFCSSVKMVSVLIKNLGMINIDSIHVNWSLNGVLQTPVTYNNTILPSGTAAVNLGNGLFMPSTPVTIKAWTSDPNGFADVNPSNDTLTITTQSSTSVPVNIGPDDTICAGSTLTLDAGFPGSQYVWDNSTYNQTRTVQYAGTYYVKVTAFDGCIGVDTMTLSLRPLPIVDLGPTQAICEGSTTTLDAGHPGATYLWDDGSTQQTRVVDTAGYYEAHVTDHFGCTGVGNVEVIMKDLPTVDGINATHADSGVYTFYPLNPMYVITYIWDFGDGTPVDTGYMVQHAYQHNGIYTVTLSMVGECTGLIIKQSRTVDVFSAPADNGGGTGINNPALEGAINVYPNPSTNLLQIENKSDAKMNRVVVYTALGQTIINEATTDSKHHQINTAALANGLYSIRIETDKGSFIQKFEVMR